MLEDDAVQRRVGDNQFFLKPLGPSSTAAPTREGGLGGEGVWKEIRYLDAGPGRIDTLNAFCAFESVRKAREEDIGHGASAQIGKTTTGRVVYQLIATMYVNMSLHPTLQVQCTLYVSTGMYSILSGILHIPTSVDLAIYPHYNELHTACTHSMGQIGWCLDEAVDEVLITGVVEEDVCMMGVEEEDEDDIVIME